MRVIKDWIGNIDRDGTRLHTGVRIQVSDQHQVAVWVNKRITAPDAVYTDTDVEVTRTGQPCSCKGDPSRTRLTQAWAAAQRETTHA